MPFLKPEFSFKNSTRFDSQIIRALDILLANEKFKFSEITQFY